MRLSSVVASPAVLLICAVASHGMPSSAEAQAPASFSLSHAEVARAVANDNRIPAGHLQGDTLTLRLELRTARWYPGADDGVGEVVQVLAEEGKAASIPAPLIRVREGTRVRLTVRNTLMHDTLVLNGLGSRERGSSAPLRVPPGTVASAEFSAGPTGTRYYWGSTTGLPLRRRDGVDSQLSGALVVDPRHGTPLADRVFVIGVWHEKKDTTKAKPWVDRDMMAINGKSWPYTERFTFAEGETVRWRWVNPTVDSHPMHLHGFFYTVDARGDSARDTLYARPDRRRVVTELLLPGTTMSMTWRAERAGNWLFHCHFAFHVSQFLSFEKVPNPEDPGAASAVDHSAHGMRGLVLGISVHPRGAAQWKDTTVGDVRGARTIRLLATPASQLGPRADSTERYAFLHDEGHGGPPTRGALVLDRGRPVRITVVNQLRAPLGVHWHGIEIQRSFVDGVPSWSGTPGHLAPSVAPGDSFIARFTPPRAGTYMVHSHTNEAHQIGEGLYDALIVRDEVSRRRASSDIVVVLGGDDDHGRINHRSVPLPIELVVGRTYRLRLVNINSDRRIVFSLASSAGLQRWRAIAKDGAALPAHQATLRPATLLTATGETADFEFTPDQVGELSLDATTHIPPMWTLRVPVHVRAARPHLAAPGGGAPID